MKSLAGWIGPAAAWFIPVALVLFPPSAFPATVTLLPDGNGTSTQWTVSGAGANWAAVTAQDGDTSYVTTSTRYDTDRYTMEDFPGSGTISSVRAYFYARRTRNPAGDLLYGLNVGGSDYTVSSTLTTSYVLYQNSWALNPDTGTAWTASDVDGIQTVIIHNQSQSRPFQVTQVYLEVDYTTPTPPPSATPTPLTSPTPTPFGYLTPSPTVTVPPTPTPTPGPVDVYFFDLSSDPGWSVEGDWAYGQPQGLGGEYGNPDPATGYTGNNVYGYNLAGDYPNDLTPTRWLTTTALDCTQVTGTTLSFYRWLNVERSSYDHAYLGASNDGLFWTTIWENPDTDVTDSSWAEHTFDISAVADGEATVYIRWGMGETDGSWRFSGWNIDDIRIRGLWHTTPPPSVTPTVTPTATPTPVGFLTPSPTPSVTPTPDGYKTPTATPTVTPIPPPSAIYSFPLDTDPGWSIDTDWAFGQPTGGGGEYGNPDPTSGFGSGTNVYGYNLSGDYANDLTPTRWLTTSEIDCSQITAAVLKFQRWLNVESNQYDHAYLQASYNGAAWIPLWENPAANVEDSSWTEYTYDVSAIADGRSLYIRWGMGETDGSWRYSGWNIDDIEIWGFWHPTPTPTATPTSTPTPTPLTTPTPSLTPTPSVTPSPSVSPTPEGYKTPIPTPTPEETPTPSPTPTAAATPSPTPERVIAGKGYATYDIMGNEDNLMKAYQQVPEAVRSGLDPAWTGANMNSVVSLVATG
ncbi:MAG: hypothetical protein P9M08_12000, partial [Candidatus Erginobacter occultus]|nr:hypothetical protein [Candidatus Erginobacter occultus]